MKNINSTFPIGANPFFGLRLQPDIHLKDWVRAPRLPKTRKKRIRAKWRKKYPQGYYIPKKDVYIIKDVLFGGSDIIVGHPETLNEALKEYGISV